MRAMEDAVRFLRERVRERPATAAGRLCLDFLGLLAAEPGDPGAQAVRSRMRQESDRAGLGTETAFLLEGVEVVRQEWARAAAEDAGVKEGLADLARRIRGTAGAGAEASGGELVEAFWRVFCPPAAGVRTHWEERVRALRARRWVKVRTLCADPVQRPAREVLFTSNALLTVAPAGSDPAGWCMGANLRERLMGVLGQPQTHWYDHPVPMGVRPENNEILYGLLGLADMLRFEQARGNAREQDRLQVVLSASVTHPGLTDLARDYVEGQLAGVHGIRGLDVHVFTERDAARLVDGFLLPAADRLGVEPRPADALNAVFGVDGPYGRHYSFLKAVAAVWHVAVNPAIRCTFKIDLDQVFPQEQLVRETGASAFEHLRSPLWGADGEDADGRPVHLGMLAGALVNHDDIHRGLFTPDVTLPEGEPAPDQWVFPGRIPQALSTRAEMMTRYGRPGMPDGRTACLSRVHVTGGTVGIRVDSLRRHRPFTLSCIGRAEDQAYLLPVLRGGGPPFLRYAHASGLFMRHDKQAFAAEAIRAAAAGKAAGDLERMVLFSEYARALPVPAEEIRAALEPFTGCFVLPLPWTTSLLSLTLKVLAMENGEQGNAGGSGGEELFRVGAHRLSDLLVRFRQDPEWLQRRLRQEETAWAFFYDILARVEDESRKGNPDAEDLVRRAGAIVRETYVNER